MSCKYEISNIRQQLYQNLIDDNNYEQFNFLRRCIFDLTYVLDELNYKLDMIIDQNMITMNEVNILRSNYEYMSNAYTAIGKLCEELDE